MPRVKVGDRYIDFPDGTPPEEIQAVLNDQFNRARQLGEYLSRPEFGTSFPINRWDEQGQTALDIAAIITSVVPGLGTATDMAALADHERRGDDVKWWEWALSTVGLGVEAGALHGIFAGVKSAKADLARLSKAQDMQGQGVDRAKIWEDTGWFQDVDGHWKYEIDDSDVAYDPVGLGRERGIQGGDYGKGKLSAALIHPEVYEAYPDSADIKAVDYPFSGKANAQYRPESITSDESITLWRGLLGDKQKKSSALHELQHAIQEREGFAAGGNVAEMAQAKDAQMARLSFLNKEAGRVARRMDELSPNGYNMPDAKSEKEYAQLRQEYDAIMSEKMGMNMIQQDPRQAYLNLAGEAEARNVQARMNMPASGRRIIPPWETLDVPEKDLIVRK